jgi:hypothetical protein
MLMPGSDGGAVPNLGAIATTAAGFRGAWAWHAGGFLELGPVGTTIPTGRGQPNSSDQRHRTVESRVVYRLSHITCSVVTRCVGAPLVSVGDEFIGQLS